MSPSWIPLGILLASLLAAGMVNASHASCGYEDERREVEVLRASVWTQQCTGASAAFRNLECGPLTLHQDVGPLTVGLCERRAPGPTNEVDDVGVWLRP